MADKNEILYSLPQFKGELSDIFDDFCDKKGITINNPEKDEYDREAGYGPGENATNIFGDDYDSIAAPAEDLILNNNGPYTVTKFSKTALLIVQAFQEILEQRGNREITIMEAQDLFVEVTRLFIRWYMDGKNKSYLIRLPRTI